MKAIVRGAVEAGALGFSTSRTLAHTAIDGEPVPGTFATEDELFAMGDALAEAGRGIFELAPAGRRGRGRHHPAQGGRLDVSAVGTHRAPGQLRHRAGRTRPPPCGAT